MNVIIKSIPNSITLLNLLAGCFGVVAAVNGDFTTTFYCMLLSLLFDFCDGFFARLLKAYSPMGKELDSLADMVSFGVVPSVILYSMGVGPYGFTIALFSCLRLAKFNIDTRQNDGFIGLNTPTNAIFFGAIGYISIVYPDSLLIQYLGDTTTLSIMASIFSILLVCELPMFSLKFKNYAFYENKTTYIFIILSVVGIAIYTVFAIPFIVLAYILVSFFKYISNKKQKN